MEFPLQRQLLLRLLVLLLAEEALHLAVLLLEVLPQVPSLPDLFDNVEAAGVLVFFEEFVGHGLLEPSVLAVGAVAAVAVFTWAAGLPLECQVGVLLGLGVSRDAISCFNELEGAGGLPNRPDARV